MVGSIGNIPGNSRPRLEDGEGNTNAVKACRSIATEVRRKDTGAWVKNTEGELLPKAGQGKGVLLQARRTKRRKRLTYL